MDLLLAPLGYVIPFLFVLTVLVFVHEYGHYIVARWGGIRVETFSIGFGRELFGWTDRHGTRWRFSAIPVGGYVKMFGDADEASRPAEGLDALTPEERAQCHQFKSVGIRAAVSAAGPAANFLFAIVIMTVLFATIGQPYTPAVVGGVKPGSPAEAAGFKPGDTVLRADGVPIDRFEDLVQTVMLNTGTPMRLDLKRGDEDVTIVATPEVADRVDHFGNHSTSAQLGLIPPQKSVAVRRDPVSALVHAVEQTWNSCATELQALGQMIMGTRSSKDLGGPLKIMMLSGQSAQLGFLDLIGLMIGISINLGLVNLFPIPILDGGHLLFYAAEAVLGRPIDRRAQEVGFRLGLALVLMLVIFTTWNDGSQMLRPVVTYLRSLVT